MAKSRFIGSKKKTPVDSAKIAERAYLIWERKGRLENSSQENWLQAERELSK